MHRPARLRSAVVLAALAVGAAPAAAQSTLADVLALAKRSAYGSRVARGAADAAAAQANAPLAGILPSAKLELGAMRTTDPINAFGTLLRQRAVSPAAFNPATLNDPAPITNYNAGLVLNAPLVNLDAWAGRAAASAGADAAANTAEWAATEATVEVVRAWYGAVLATEKLAMLQTARDAAAAHVAQAKAMRTSGLATRSDELLADLRLGELDTQILQAKADIATARRGLELRVGRALPAVALPEALPTAARIGPLLEVRTNGATRADVRAADLGRNAARFDLNRTRAAMLPRINGFARWDWNSALRPWAGRENWTAGVMVSLPLFDSNAHLSDAQAAAGRWQQANAGADAMAARASLEQLQAQQAADVARQQLAIAERAVAQSQEAHRLVARRYEGGLATIAELLGAHAAATQAALGHSAARWAAIGAAAELRRAYGLPTDDLARLDTHDAVAAATR